ncbi:MAG: PilZ domain-containing protein [Novosphingobium sp.]
MADSEARNEDRARVILRAALRDGGREREACLLDLSSRGLLATSTPPPRRGAYVELTVGRHRLDGQVQWSEGRRFGVRLRERVDVLAVMGNEAGPTALKAARAARGRPSMEARAAYMRHVAQGFTYGLLMAGGAAGATVAAQMVHHSLSVPFAEAGLALQGK